MATKEEKELLRKDLCARLPYGVKCKIAHSYKDKATQDVVTLTEMSHISPECYFEKSDEYEKIENVMPYLRPMSSMTDEEKEELEDLNMNPFSGSVTDWLNAHHFDFRNLIEKGLALEASGGMYNIKKG